jgi:hypothetical protein
MEESEDSLHNNQWETDILGINCLPQCVAIEQDKSIF